jgi:iron complex transport system ATP-binding protein
MTTGRLFSMRNLSFSYGDRRVIKGIDLDISKGEFVAIVGPNGTGKSTLLKLLSGYLAPEAGTIEFLGRHLHEYSRKSLARYVSTLPQSLDVPFSYTVEEFVMMGRYPHRKGRFDYESDEGPFVGDVMASMGIEGLSGREVNELSEGERQKVYLAQCIAQDPEVLLLDEPVSHLDIKYQVRTLEVLHALNRDGLTILMILHDLNLAAEFASRVILLSGGSLYADGTPEETITFGNIEAVYDTVVIVRENPVTGKPFVMPISRRYLE